MTDEDEPKKMSKALEKTIKQAEKDLAEGKASPIFDNAEDVFKWLGI